MSERHASLRDKIVFDMKRSTGRTRTMTSGETMRDRLRLARRLWGWNQEELAKASGVGVATIRRIETEKVAFRLETVKRLADALYVRDEWIVYGNEPMVGIYQMTPDAQHDAHTGPGSAGLPGYVVIDPGGPWRHPDDDDEAWEIDPAWQKEENR